MEDLISIIIPMYNAQDFIAKLLDCLKNQTYKQLEIIIINDGSTDNSLSIVQECSKRDDRIKIISIPNGGVSNARNLGIKNATGKYITFLDSDDYIELDTYEKFIDKIHQFNVQVLRSNYIQEDTDGNLISNGDLLDLKNSLLDHNLVKGKLLAYIFDGKIPTYTPLIFAEASLIKSLSFRTDIHMMEDLLFCLELFYKCNGLFLFDYKSYHYVVNSSSSSKSRSKLLRNYNDTLKVVEILENEFNFDKELFTKIYYIYSTMLIKYILRTFNENDEFQISYSQMVKMLSNDTAVRLFKNVDLSKYDNEYLKNSARYIINSNYKGLYDYAVKIRDIKL